ncbi:MAG: portal protein, partial [Minisyncoccota bacterium]
MSDLTQFHIQKLATLRQDRGSWETQWEEAASLIVPAHRNSFQGRGSDNAFGASGQKKTELQYDATVGIAAQRFASVIESLATPQSNVWHRLVPADKTLKRNRSVRLFFDELNERLLSLRYRPSANFVGNSQQVYLSLGVYGNGCLFVDTPENTNGLRYRSIHLGEVHFIEDHAGVVDSFYRCFWLTARQIAQQFSQPGDTVPEAVTEAVKNPLQAEKKFEVLHCCYPRNDRDPRRIDKKGMPFASLYIFVQTQDLLRESGYNSFPLPTARYTQSTGEVYGRGPAQWVLPAIKVLNQEKKTVLVQGHRAVSPVLLSHDDGIVGSFSLKPDSINPGTMTKDGKRLVDVLPTGRVDIGFDLMEMERSVINDAFLITLFQILIDTP